MAPDITPVSYPNRSPPSPALSTQRSKVKLALEADGDRAEAAAEAGNGELSRVSLSCSLPEPAATWLAPSVALLWCSSRSFSE
eukprot:scaffold910_cov396-Prasinococcus_capsulatus_cf.AAC.24